MDRVVCEWCQNENTAKSTHCSQCGAPLFGKDHISDPASNAASMPPPPQYGYPPAPSYSYQSAPQTGWPSGYRRRRWTWLFAIFPVFIIGAGVVSSIQAGRHDSSSSSSSVSTPPIDFHSADGLSGLLTGIRNRFGDTMGYELDVGPNNDDATLTRADPNNNSHQKMYVYSDSKWIDWDTNPLPPAGYAVADLSKFNVTAVTATLKGAPQSLGMTDVGSTDLLVHGLADGSLNLTADINGPGADSGTIDINPDGSVKALHPPS